MSDPQPARVALLDMDGVMVDFTGPALALHGTTQEKLYAAQEAKGQWEFEQLLRITPEEFWEPINQDMDFWEELPKTPEADELVAEVEKRFGRKNVGILTAPTQEESCFTGKRRWLLRHFPQFASRLAFAHDKSLFASPRHILIDDRDKNVKEFRKAGGRSVIVPRVWNSYHTHQDVLGYVRLQLDWLEQEPVG